MSHRKDCGCSVCRPEAHATIAPAPSRPEILGPDVAIVVLSDRIETLEAASKTADLALAERIKALEERVQILDDILSKVLEPKG